MIRSSLLALVLSSCVVGCSYVQMLPSSACEEVTYHRVHNHVRVYAECEL